MKKSTTPQGCIYSIDYGNYDILTDKESLKKIKEGEDLKMDVYHNSYLFNSVDDIKSWMKKELILGLLSEEECLERDNEVIIKPYNNMAEKITINISQNLLDNLIKSEGDRYEYCYNSRGNKINFYINESADRDELQEQINKHKRIHSKIKHSSE